MRRRLPPAIPCVIYGDVTCPQGRMLSLAITTSVSIARFLDPLLLFLVAMAVLLRAGFRRTRPARGWARRARIGLWIAWAGLDPRAAVHLGLAHVLERDPRPDLQHALAGHDPDKAALVVLAAGIRTYDASVSLCGERMDGTTTPSRPHRRPPVELSTASGWSIVSGCRRPSLLHEGSAGHHGRAACGRAGW